MQENISEVQFLFEITLFLTVL